MKYSDQFIDWLIEEGYTHCFFVAGGNIMHLLNSVRTKMTCIPFVNEVGAAIAAEYFTVAASLNGEKAFVLVTAGPGFTNTVTAIASAWTESRELLVVGGQVKSADLSMGLVRQRGIQEINGIDIAKPITKGALQITRPESKKTITDLIRLGSTGRKGPVFIEFTLDAQGASALIEEQRPVEAAPPASDVARGDIEKALTAIGLAKRPVFLLGAGVTRQTANLLAGQFERIAIPIMLTWNGADLFPSEHSLNMGRPNTWGQRSSNILLQQADLLIAVGTRLGIQQTGFAWDEFLPKGKIIQIDIDQAELDKHHPEKQLAIRADANEFLRGLLPTLAPRPIWAEWLEFSKEVRLLLPLAEAANTTGDAFINPFSLMDEISCLSDPDDMIIPCSSGGSFTVAMQSFNLKGHQKMITNKGMASMGYGLSGAIGASFAARNRNTVLLEGDGGFAQNLQELGTVAANKLNLKMFIFSNRGYASIRMTQRNYFNGAWIGCDEDTGLGLPDWQQLAKAYGVPFVQLSENFDDRQLQLSAIFQKKGPVFVVVPIDPEQTYYPKIASRILADGTMKSNPLHLMEPPLDEVLSRRVLKYM